MEADHRYLVTAWPKRGHRRPDAPPLAACVEAASFTEALKKFVSEHPETGPLMAVEHPERPDGLSPAVWTVRGPSWVIEINVERPENPGGARTWRGSARWEWKQEARAKRMSEDAMGDGGQGRT